ncbi:OLC1v1004652C1 [Oldenlandia corymbosa var. corymbosa]|uniref:OLC1v1004652C1 n=1 Tax=Oldenlandia corymbosa var. corymbosa TaxID=529605 RepID=A0AAV1DCT1_OLDCO|nr:OLC1v1004652C1 [Oldenlandia corymbosa var. corymbosa]
MAPSIALFFTLVLLTGIQVSTSHLLKGSVTCLDCNAHDDLSGIKVLIKCSNVRKMVVATTTEEGTFETDLPKDSTTKTTTPNCLAKILGGPSLLYTSGTKTISRVTKLKEHDEYYTNSQPLNFYTSCPSKQEAKCASMADKEFGSSKTVDVPLPREWGLAPSSYYFPFIPIIGIP